RAVAGEAEATRRAARHLRVVHAGAADGDQGGHVAAVDLDLRVGRRDRRGAGGPIVVGAALVWPQILAPRQAIALTLKALELLGTPEHVRLTAGWQRLEGRALRAAVVDDVALAKPIAAPQIGVEGFRPIAAPAAIGVGARILAVARRIV